MTKQSNIIQFPQVKDSLDFGGMGIKIDVENQRESWNATFTSVQTALRFCNFDHVEGEKKVRNIHDDGEPTSSMQWAPIGRKVWIISKQWSQ